MSDHELRTREIGRLTAREAGSGNRGFSAIAVPWNVEIEVWGERESFAPGSIEPSDIGVKVYWRHREVIGKITGHRDGEAGWEIDAEISDVALGRDAATLLDDGVIDRCSIGFRPIEWTERIDEDGVRHITYTRAEVIEVSLVPVPAYAGAAVTDVRENPTPRKENPVPETQTPDLADVRASIEDLSRRIDLLPTREDTAPVELGIGSYGEFIKGIASRDATALDLATRAFEGAVISDTYVDAAWIGDFAKIEKEVTRFLNLITHTKDLPGKGMSVEFSKITADTVKVEEQKKEADTLAYGKIGIDVDSVPVKTFGGWTSLSRQVIERASVDHLAKTFTALFRRYLRAIELYGRSIFTGYLASADPVLTLGANLASADVDTWISLILDLVEHSDTTDYPATKLVVSRPVFEALAALPEEPKALKFTGTHPDGAGDLTVQNLTGSLITFPVVMLPNWEGSNIVGLNPEAITVKEAPGAPYRLQDGDITNLTNAYSVYGYAAGAITAPSGIVPVEIPA